MNVAATSGIEGHRKLSTEWIVATEFDVLLLGFDPGQSADQVLRAYPHLSSTTAVREGQVIVMAPRHTMTVSPFLLQGVARLARELHPEVDIPEPSWR